MSASLVGSEMCIRDRQEIMHALPAAGSYLLPIARPAIAAGTPGEDKAVSYTHLTLPTICSV
eukprot:506020-Alexandrium_andersonii.AAC.1